jgi:acyl-CoA dehydrogenase
MNFDLTVEQLAIRETVQSVCAQFPEAYRRERDSDGAFPADFYRAMSSAGWLGGAIPETYDGSGMGVQEAASMAQTIARSGACMSGCSSVHMNIFGLMPLTVFGTEEQKRRWFPPIAKGQVKACFSVTEPDAGLNTMRLKTRAVRQGIRRNFM